MKLFLLISLAVAVSADVSEYKGKDTEAKVLSQRLEIEPDGSAFSFGYETDNKIKVDVNADVNNRDSENPALEQIGSVSFVSQEGLPISWDFGAGLNGYEARGNVIPTPPPSPDYVIRLLEYIASRPQPTQSAKVFIQSP